MGRNGTILEIGIERQKEIAQIGQIPKLGGHRSIEQVVGHIQMFQLFQMLKLLATCEYFIGDTDLENLQKNVHSSNN